MKLSRVFAGYFLLSINLAVLFVLKQRIHAPAAELIFIALALVFAILIMHGFRHDHVWTAPTLMIFLALALANLVYLFIATKAVIMFSATTIINVVGMTRCLVWALEEEPEQEEIEFYDVPSEDAVEVEYQQEKQRRKKTNARKKKQ